MKGTAACIIWYTLLDCRDSHKRRMNGYGPECPGCRIADFETLEECGGCLFNNVPYMNKDSSSMCTNEGKELLKQMEDV